MSSGICEGFNNKIKNLKKTCYGLHNFDTFRKRILLCCGSVKFLNDPVPLFGRLTDDDKEVQP